MGGPRGHRPGRGHRGGGPRADLLALLHDQARGQRHRPVSRVPDRADARWRHRGGDPRGAGGYPDDDSPAGAMRGTLSALAIVTAVLAAAGCATTRKAVATPPPPPPPVASTPPAPAPATPSPKPPPAPAPPAQPELPSVPNTGLPKVTPPPPAATAPPPQAPPTPPPPPPASPPPKREPPPVLSPQVTSAEALRLTQQARPRIEGAEKLVGQLELRRLAREEQDTVATIKDFRAKSKEAMATRDVQRAYN